MACLPVGMFAGDLVVGRFVAPRVRETLSGPLVALLGLPFVLLGLTVSLPVAPGSLVLSGAASAGAVDDPRRTGEATGTSEHVL